jgi:hypothetical protein
MKKVPNGVSAAGVLVFMMHCTLPQLVTASSTVITPCLAHLAPQRSGMTARHNTGSTFLVYKFALAIAAPFLGRGIIKDVMMSLTQTAAQLN